MNNNLVKALVLIGVLGISALANADVKGGVSYTLKFGKGMESSHNLGIYVRDLDYTDFDETVTSSNREYISGDVVFEGENLPVLSPSSNEPELVFGDIVNAIAYSSDATDVNEITNVTDRFSDTVRGLELRLDIPLTSRFLKDSSIELSGIYGKNDLHGKVGVGYDFENNNFTLPVGVSNGNFEIGKNLVDSLDSGYNIRLNSTGALGDFNSSLTDVSETSELLCNNGFGELQLTKVDTGKTYFSCDFN